MKTTKKMKDYTIKAYQKDDPNKKYRIFYMLINYDEKSIISQGGLKRLSTKRNITKDKQGGIIIFPADRYIKRLNLCDTVDWIIEQMEVLKKKDILSKRYNKKIKQEEYIYTWSIGKFFALELDNWNKYSFGIEVMGLTSQELLAFALRFRENFRTNGAVIKDYNEGKLIEIVEKK